MSLRVDGFNLITSISESLNLPIGNNTQRPSTLVNGMMRYNIESNKVEVYANDRWRTLASSIIYSNSPIGSGTSKIYSWGENAYGEGLFATSDSPCKVPTISGENFDFKKIVCSLYNDATLN